jgi:hypothetical protein
VSLDVTCMTTTLAWIRLSSGTKNAPGSLPMMQLSLDSPASCCASCTCCCAVCLQLELEQQIAEREAARRASKAAAAARETAEAAARAAAPPPWDPAAKAFARGGGGEPLRSVDGAAVTDLRNQRHRWVCNVREAAQCMSCFPQEPVQLCVVMQG